MARAYIGISGYIYKHWKGAFYPPRLAARRWLEFASRHFNSIELNGTFYSLKSPSVFSRWAEQVADDFVFAVKGGRFITHNKKLRDVGTALGNFFAQGPLALGTRLGPFLWQLPELVRYDRERIDTFLAQLPRTTQQAAAVARNHDERLKRGTLTETSLDLPLRHCMEVRHSSYNQPEFFELLRQHGVAYVIADTAGRFLWAEEVTTDFVYVRLHGSKQLYVSQYNPAELEEWAQRIRRWLAEGRDVYVYFDNDALGHAPYDALQLAELVNPTGQEPPRHPGSEFVGRTQD